MAKVLTDAKISIGAYMFPDRKLPCLCIDDGAGKITVYGHFNSLEGADKFMNELGKLVKATFEGDK